MNSLPARRIPKPCQFKALPSHLTPTFSTLARPLANIPIFFSFQPTWGRGAWSYDFSPSSLPLSVLDTRHSPPLSPLFPLHTNTDLVCLLFPLLAQNQGGVPPRENVGAPTFSIFPVIFRTFLLIRTCPPRKAAATQPKRARQASPLQEIRDVDHWARATSPEVSAPTHHPPLATLLTSAWPLGTEGYTVRRRNGG